MILPHAYLSHATRIDAEFLRQRGIGGLLLDIDGTLKDFSAEEVPQRVVAWLDELRRAGIGLCLVSNGRPHRIGLLAEKLKLPFIAQAMKPWPRGCRRALKLLDLPAERVAIVGDQIFADVMAGRLASLYTILVCPTSRVEPWFTRLKRPLEAPIRALLRRRLDTIVPGA
jgi:HAD superfamily phosphatase (TIGR01668 family)